MLLCACVCHVCDCVYVNARMLHVECVYVNVCESASFYVLSIFSITNHSTIINQFIGGSRSVH